MKSRLINSREIEAVVFDMAGTTINEGKIVYESVRSALEKFDCHYTLKEVISRVGGMNKKEGIKVLMELKLGEVDKDEVAKAAELFRKIVEDAYINDESIKEMDGASELFTYLIQHNIRVVLDTGYFRSTANILIDKMGWEQRNLIDFSVTSDEVDQGRPAPLMIQRAQAYLEIENGHQIVKVGDTRSDIEEGLNAGCRYIIGITSDQYTEEDLIAMGATHAVNSLRELNELIVK